jgi:hypothetical protein
MLPSTKLLGVANEYYLKHRNFIVLAMAILYGYSLYKIIYACQPSGLDFNTFYASIDNVYLGRSPYKYFTLNLPIFIWSFKWLHYMEQPHALFLWSVLSVIQYVIYLRISFALLPFDNSNKKKVTDLASGLFFISYPVLFGFILGQITALICLLTIAGFYLYKKKCDCLTGAIWGYLAAIKLFPLLLLFFLISCKRYQACVYLLLFFLLFTFLPLIEFPLSYYADYFVMVKKVTWFNHSWNLSIFGILYKLYWLNGGLKFYFELLRYCSVILWSIIFVFYIINIMIVMQTSQENYKFSLTIIFMILLSPLGWLYYLPLVVFPLLITWSTIDFKKTRHFYYWLLSYLFLLYPMPNISNSITVGSSTKVLLLCFFNTIGMGLLGWLTIQLAKKNSQLDVQTNPVLTDKYYRVFCSVILLGLLLSIYGMAKFYPLFLSKYSVAAP